MENLEESLKSMKQEKAKAKSAFMRAIKQLLEFVEEPNRRQVRYGQAKLDNAQERAMKITSALSEHYQLQKNGKASQKTNW